MQHQHGQEPASAPEPPRAPTTWRTLAAWLVGGAGVVQAIQLVVDCVRALLERF